MAGRRKTSRRGLPRVEGMGEGEVPPPPARVPAWRRRLAEGVKGRPNREETCGLRTFISAMSGGLKRGPVHLRRGYWGWGGGGGRANGLFE